MQDKIVIVTGANSGIGKVAATELAKMGASVVMVCRSQERGAAAMAEVKRDSGSSDVTLMLCDMSSFDSIRAFTAKFKAEYDRLDVLLNNAGAIFTNRKESADGIELTFAVNHLGYYLVAVELAELLKASAPARIVNVSSDAHRVNSFDFDDYERKNSYSRFGFTEYGESKLANVLFTYELARRLEGTGVTVNALHPGFVRTGFSTNNGALAGVLMATLGRLFAVSPQKGAETSVYLASSAEVANITGKYFADKREKRSTSLTHDLAAQERLWKLSADLTGATLAA